MNFYRTLAIIAFQFITVASSLYAQDTTSEMKSTAVDTTDNSAAPDEFIPVEQPPQFDMKELSARIIYPEEARKNGIEGEVRVRVLVSKFGKVRRTLIDHSDNLLLEEAAVNAVRELQFTPAIQYGKPTEVWVSIPINFTLN